jgi:mortality factor 4-like protein 1
MISQSEENKRLLKLPRKPNVSDFFIDFLDFKNKKESIETYKTYEDMCNAFKDYFDKSLPKICLYRQERSQYDMIYKELGDDMIPSNIYGVEHLLRLFIRLPRIMSQVFVEEGLISQTNDIFQEILKFISQNKNKYFCDMQYVSIEEAMIFSNDLLSKPLETLSPSGRPARHNAGINPALDI